MRRGQHHLEQREEQSPPARQFSGPQHSQHLQHPQNPQHHQHPQQPQHGYSGFMHPAGMGEDNRRTPYGSDMAPMTNSPHHTASSSGSIYLPPQSPMQAPQPSRPGMLPSPSSMNFPNAPSLPPISPPTTSLHTSAQAVHLQDLQHQVSVKTLAFQTLQREYDSLLQKLERQRTKCATLEKKFEVSDIEINGLIDEKEKLQAQVNALESQVEDLQQGRDEARRQLVANGAQYMRIMDMANRLQAQGSDDKKRWETERCELEQRIKVLEEAMVTGSERPAGDAEHDMGTSPPPSIILSHNPHLSPAASTSSAETINVLRVEIGRLRSRTQTLETALQTMREESISIRAAARQLVESGGKIENVVQGAVGG
jgi:predicted  nucleic acid-binding Zn-ribbon protein